MKEFNRQEQKSLASWAADCAERVLPFFENKYPKDERPRKAIEACRAWAKTGIFKMADIRKASLSAHAAARKAKRDEKACFAARAAGQAVATAHVLEHAFGAAYYSLKIASSSKAKLAREHKWLSKHIPKNLRARWKDWKSRRLPKKLKLD
jgi:hypothetical protein